MFWKIKYVWDYDYKNTEVMIYEIISDYELEKIVVELIDEFGCNNK